MPGTELFQQIDESIKKFGWHVVMIEEDDDGPSFGYSIGLHRTFGAPEVVMFGLKVAVLHSIINHIGELTRAGERFQDWHEAEDVLNDYDVVFRAAEARHYGEYFGAAVRYYGSEEFPVLQCVWPDGLGRYPWHPEFPTNLQVRQPVLSDDRSWPFHEGKNRAAFTTTQVLDQSHPVLFVAHDYDQSWQFLCGATNAPEDGRLISLESALALDGTLQQIASLPLGAGARRAKVGAPWVLEELPDDADED